MAIETKTIGATGRNYSTITAWEAAIDNTTYPNPNTDVVGECYDDSAFDETVTINAAPSNVDSIKLTVASGERHDGTAGTGVRIVYGTTNKKFEVFGSKPTTVEWVEIDGANRSSNAPVMYVNAGQTTACTIQRCIFHDTLRDYSTGDAVLIWTQCNFQNCIIYDVDNNWSGGSNVYGMFANLFSASTANMQNLTIHNVSMSHAGSTGNAHGHNCAAAGTTVVRNTIVTDTSVAGSGTASDFSGTPDTEAYNLSSDATAAGTGSLTSKASADQFVSTTGGSEDLHLKSGADAIDAGTDLATTPSGINFDIDNRDRDASGDTWDMGADEFVTASSDVFFENRHALSCGMKPLTAAGMPGVLIE